MKYLNDNIPLDINWLNVKIKSIIIKLNFNYNDRKKITFKKVFKIFGMFKICLKMYF